MNITQTFNMVKKMSLTQGRSKIPKHNGKEKRKEVMNNLNKRLQKSRELFHNGCEILIPIEKEEEELRIFENEIKELDDLVQKCYAQVIKDDLKLKTEEKQHSRILGEQLQTSFDSQMVQQFFQKSPNLLNAYEEAKNKLASFWNCQQDQLSHIKCLKIESKTVKEGGSIQMIHQDTINSDNAQFFFFLTRSEQTYFYKKTNQFVNDKIKEQKESIQSWSYELTSYKWFRMLDKQNKGPKLKTLIELYQKFYAIFTERVTKSHLERDNGSEIFEAGSTAIFLGNTLHCGIPRTKTENRRFLFFSFQNPNLKQDKFDYDEQLNCILTCNKLFLNTATYFDQILKLLQQKQQILFVNQKVFLTNKNIAKKLKDGKVISDQYKQNDPLYNFENVIQCYLNSLMQIEDDNNKNILQELHEYYDRNFEQLEEFNTAADVQKFLKKKIKK